MVGTKRITDFTSAGTVDGSEELPLWQAGATRKATVSAILADLGLSVSDLSDISALGLTAYGLAFLELANRAALLPVLGTGTASSSTYLRGDGAWAAISNNGLELGYSDSTAGKTSTNTGAVTADKISGVSVTVTGAGRPVEIQWGVGGIRNSVATNWMALGLITNSVADDADFFFNPSTSIPVARQYTRRLVLTNAASYTFELGVSMLGGTTVVGAGARIWLSVTQR